MPIFALGSFSEEFGIDSDTGDVFTKGQTLLTDTTYVIYGVVFDTGEPGQPQNIGKLAELETQSWMQLKIPKPGVKFDSH